MKKNKRIAILGDSLNMPRPDEGIEYENLYSFLLIKEGYHVINKSKRANDTNLQTKSQNLLDDIVFLRPNVLIVHLGIVDCAPRIFRRYEQKIINYLPLLLKKNIIKLCSKYRYFITKYRKITYVNEKEFEENLIKIIETAKDFVEKIIIIKILNTSEENNKRSYGFYNNILNYNKIIEKISNKYDCIKIIDPNLFEKKGLLSDGIHINKDLHQFLFEEILKILKN